MVDEVLVQVAVAQDPDQTYQDLHNQLPDRLKLEEIGRLTLMIHTNYSFSGNHMYYISGRQGRPRLIKYEDLQHWQNLIAEEVEGIFEDYDSDTIFGYEVHAMIDQGESGWLTNGNWLRRTDLTNIWKPLEDALATHFCDDSQCYSQRMEKFLFDDRELPEEFKKLDDFPFRVLLSYTVYTQGK